MEVVPGSSTKNPFESLLGSWLIQGRWVPDRCGPWTSLRRLPQTSPMAEVVGMAAAAQLNPPDAESLAMFIDSIMVVSELNRPQAPLQLCKAYHSGVLRNARLQLGWKAMEGKASYIYAHKYDDKPHFLESLAPEVRHQVLGNKTVDEQADEARSSPLGCRLLRY